MTNVRGNGHPLDGAAFASLRLAVRLRRPGPDAPPLSLLTQRRATALTWAVRYAHRGLMLWSTLAYYRLRACGAGPTTFCILGTYDIVFLETYDYYDHALRT